MLFSHTHPRRCGRRSVGFLNLPTRRSFGRAKKTAIVCAQALVPQAVLCGWTLVLHRVLVTLLTTAKWRIPPQERDKSPAAWKMGFISMGSEEELIPLMRRWSYHYGTRARCSLSKRHLCRARTCVLHTVTSHAGVQGALWKDEFLSRFCCVRATQHGCP